MRKKFSRVLAMVVGGFVGGYFGYWIGHLAGWSEDAEWPFHIGGGDRAILVSIGLSVVCVLVAALAMALPSVFRARRLREVGRLTPATVVDVWDLGMASTMGGRRHQIGFVVDVRPGDAETIRAKGTQWLPVPELQGLRPGLEVTVRYDPEHPKAVVIESTEASTEALVAGR